MSDRADPLLRWVWAGPDGKPLEGEVQILPQMYASDRLHVGSLSSVRGRRLADGSWWEIYYWTPLRAKQA